MRQVRQNKYQVTFDQAFEDVIKACAKSHESTWIGPEVLSAYIAFHREGYAHSVEVWDEEELVGGLYGVHLKRMFCGESMFSLRKNTSKLAFYYLVQKLKSLNVELFDSQVLNPHTASLGAKAVARSTFLRRVSRALSGKVPWRNDWSSPLPSQ